MPLCYFSGIGTNTDCAQLCHSDTAVVLIQIQIVHNYATLLLQWYWYKYRLCTIMPLCYCSGIGTNTDCAQLCHSATAVVLVQIQIVHNYATLLLQWYWYKYRLCTIMPLCYCSGIGTNTDCAQLCHSATAVVMVQIQIVHNYATLLLQWYWYKYRLCTIMPLCYCSGIGTNTDCAQLCHYATAVGLVQLHICWDGGVRLPEMENRINPGLKARVLLGGPLVTEDRETRFTNTDCEQLCHSTTAVGLVHTLISEILLLYVQYDFHYLGEGRIH